MTDLAIFSGHRFLEILSGPWAGGVGTKSMLEMLLISPVVGVLGVWVTLSRLSYMAESFSHSLLPGTVVAAAIGLPIIAGAPVAAAVSAAALAWLLVSRQKLKIGRDSAVAVVVTTMLALGVAVATLPAAPPRLQELLFGNVLAITSLDLALTTSLAALVMLGLRVFHRDLTVSVFDREAALSLGVSTKFADLLLIAFIAAAITVAVQGLGNLLIAGLLLAPASAAAHLTRKLQSTFILATAFAAFSGVGGLYLSYYAEVAVGSSICLTAILIYVVARLARPSLAYRVTV